MTVLVTGACGWIGRQVCEYLAERGVDVVGADLAETDGQWIRFQRLDITQPLDFPAGGIDAVIHCAGYAHRPNETPAEQKRFYAVNRDGTRNVLDWCVRNGVRRFLYVGSIASYDWKAANGKPVDEDHPVRLDTHYARSKHEGEQLVAASLLDWRIVRLATVFGEGDQANFSRMVQAMKRRLFFIPGKGEARKSVIPVDLAAALISRFVLMEAVPHRIINLALPEAPSLAEICSAYHAVCGLPRVLKVPLVLVRFLGKCGDLAVKMFRRFPFTSQTLGKLTQSTEVSTRRMGACFADYDFGFFSDYLECSKEYYKSL